MGQDPVLWVFLGCASDLSLLLLWAIRSLPGIQEPSGLEASPSLVQDLLLLRTSPPPQHIFKVCERAQEGVLADSEIDTVS